MTRRKVNVKLSKFCIHFMYENTQVLDQNISHSTSTLFNQV